ncbi:MAG: thiamine phosphate synthase [Oscillospiraceae bacterium]|nr:thiamine phosphate synthase [Oscillospiraceae bacterium]MCI9669410.1 thiamine phosphate synthase [Oscillospiraceae bacterium]
MCAALRLYAVTDRSWLGNGTLSDAVEAALRGGATMVQLREKSLTQADFLQEAKTLAALCARFQIPFLINDNLEIALACNADGVHVGQDDMDPQKARALLGPGKILGVSAHTVQQALAAEKTGADYLGVGAVFSTSTKQDAASVPLETVREICQAVSIPVVAIGGISADNILSLQNSGVVGAAVVSALFAAEDIFSAAQNLSRLTKEAFL